MVSAAPCSASASTRANATSSSWPDSPCTSCMIPASRFIRVALTMSRVSPYGRKSEIPASSTIANAKSVAMDRRLLSVSMSEIAPFRKITDPAVKSGAAARKDLDFGAGDTPATKRRMGCEAGIQRQRGARRTTDKAAVESGGKTSGLRLAPCLRRTAIFRVRYAAAACVEERDAASVVSFWAGNAQRGTQTHF